VVTPAQIAAGTEPNVYAPPTDRVAAVARIALSKRYPSSECPKHVAALSKALFEEPPPFANEAYSDIYRAAATD
jgi:hypothetical protein